MTEPLTILVIVLFVYFVVYNLVTLALLVMSYGEMSWLVRGRQPGRGGLRPLAQRPGVSVVVAAYNEQELVVTSARAFLAQSYSPLEVVIVDDGSRDETFQRLADAFGLVALPPGGGLPPDTAPLRGLYASKHDPRLRVAQKENGGRADALNLGIAIARNELVAVADADSILEPDAVALALRPFEEHPDDCLASGGNVRVVNASKVVDGRVVDPRVSWYGVGATQVIEYLRGFLGVRIAWSRMNGLAIISGAFGVFRRDLLVAIGGFLHGSLGEDLEVTLHLHHTFRPDWPTARVAFVPEAVCWTQAPDTLRGLRTQRIRWQVGLLETIRLHKGMLARPRYGAVGLLALPYAALFEAISAILEVLGYVIAILLVISDAGKWPYLVALLGVSILLGQVQSMLALLIEETGFRKYGRAGMTRLLGWALLEIFWYRPLLAIWRTWGTALLLLGRRPGWGKIPRRAMDTPPTESLVPLTR